MDEVKIMDDDGDMECQRKMNLGCVFVGCSGAKCVSIGRDVVMC